MNSSTNNDIKESLEYLGLDLNNVPDFLKNTLSASYNIPSKSYEENSYKVYKYIDVRDIEILITPMNRLDPLIDKWKNATSIYPYLSPKNDEDLPKNEILLDMLNNTNINHIKAIEEEQDLYKNSVPFKVKYKENYVWQIFYSDTSNKYFMIVTTEDSEYNCFFYLLKKQLEAIATDVASKIYVPISHLEYSGTYLRRSELEDIENFLWLFTSDWPLVYEVYDKNDNLTIQIVGETVVYEKIKSNYKIVLHDKTESFEFFNLIKALFILQTELPKNYKFYCKIDEFGGLEFCYNNKKILYDDLKSFTKNEYLTIIQNIKETDNINKEYEKKLKQLRIIEKEKQNEYWLKEREISTYLECRKSLVGRLKYFFKHNKLKKKIESKHTFAEENIEDKEINDDSYKIKEFCTIEDLIKISMDFDKKMSIQKNYSLDIFAAENKIEMLENKIKNAILYINEIDKHNKSIFDFWKFTSKDDNLVLNAGDLENEENKIQLERVFDYKEDFEDLGVKLDNLQKFNLSKEECDSIFAVSKAIDIINSLQDTFSNDNIIIQSLENLENEAMQSKELFLKEDFDIFGGIAKDKTKISSLAGKHHREIEKSKFKVFEITKNTTVEQYKQTLEEILKNIESALLKIKTLISMSVYNYQDDVNVNKYMMFHIDPDNVIDKLNDTTINMIRYNIKEGMPCVFLSNIIYFDNYNKTLPAGMNISDEVIIDNGRYEKELVCEKIFRINKIIDDINIVTQTVNIKEYNLNESY